VTQNGEKGDKDSSSSTYPSTSNTAAPQETANGTSSDDAYRIPVGFENAMKELDKYIQRQKELEETFN